MVEVFIHASTPLVSSKRPEKRVRVPRALCFPALVELPHTLFQALSFPREIPLIADDQFLFGRSALGEWFFVGVNRFHEGPEHSADEHARAGSAFRKPYRGQPSNGPS